MLQSIVSALDASFAEFKAECDVAREQHGEWLRETMFLTEKQLLNHSCVRLRHSKTAQPACLPACAGRGEAACLPGRAAADVCPVC